MAGGAVSQIASRSQTQMSLLRWALLCVPAVVLGGAVSAGLTEPGFDNPWFAALRQPSFLPPAWLFPVAWTILYAGLGLALAILLHARGAQGRGLLLGVFFAQLALNYAWPPTFFGLHQISAALGIIAAMVALTAFLVARTWTVRRAVALLLLPYLAWLVFAAALNYQVMALNPDADEVAPAASRTDIPFR